MSSSDLHAVTQILDGRSPTEVWLATEEAARSLADADRREALYRAMHPRPDPSLAPLLRALLAHEVAYRRTPPANDERFEHLYWCALLLSHAGEVSDVLALWRAKNTDFDTRIGLDVQFLVGAGVEPTLAFLAQSSDPDAPAAAAYLTRCAQARDFADLAGWRASREAYFGAAG